MDILNIPGLAVLDYKIDDNEAGHLFEAEITEPPPTFCPKCKSERKSKNGKTYGINKHDKRWYYYRDRPLRGYRVIISIHAQRFRCQDDQCNATFQQKIPGADSKRLMTDRCIEWIREQGLRDTHLDLAEKVGCTESTVREIVEPYIKKISDAYKPYLPKWLGIDDNKLNHNVCCVLTDLGEKKPIHILPDRKKQTLAGWLWDFRDSNELQGVSIDMCRPFEKAVRSVFPDVLIVVDKFHVLQMAQKGLNDTRINKAKQRNNKQRLEWLRNMALLRKRAHKLDPLIKLYVDAWLEDEPMLKEAYNLKESFFRIYDLKDPIAAGIALDDWRASVSPTMKPFFKDLLSATKNWRTEILAYFTAGITNGYTEGFNSVAKAKNRAGKGYSFEVLRGRLLFGNQPRLNTLKLDMAREWKRESKATGEVRTPAKRRKRQSWYQCPCCGGIYKGRTLQFQKAPTVPLEGTHNFKNNLSCIHRTASELPCAKPTISELVPNVHIHPISARSLDSTPIQAVEKISNESHEDMEADDWESASRFSANQISTGDSVADSETDKSISNSESKEPIVSAISAAMIENFPGPATSPMAVIDQQPSQNEAVCARATKKAVKGEILARDLHRGFPVLPEEPLDQLSFAFTA